MGLSTTLIGAAAGLRARPGALAPWLLCLLRFGQGIGLGGEWGGAALLATENAPRGRRAWFGMFPQLGPPLGFLMANGLFLGLLLGLGEAAFVAWAWRVPFLVSAVLVAIGLYLRVSMQETPAFRGRHARATSASRVPLAEVLRHHWRAAAPGLARHRRLLRAVLHLDGLRARLWRRRRATSRAPISSRCSASRSSSWRSRRRSRPRSPTVSAAARCCWRRARSRRCRVRCCRALLGGGSAGEVAGLPLPRARR